MHTPRHYRGGYQFAGLAALAQKLRKEQTSAEELLWALLRNERVLNEVEFVLDEIATCLTNSQLSDKGRIGE
jgi:very-short-patch-repair endonuclease